VPGGHSDSPGTGRAYGCGSAPDFDRLPPPTRECDSVVWLLDGTTAAPPASKARRGRARRVTSGLGSAGGTAGRIDEGVWMTWSWRYEDAAGAELAEPTQEAFGSKADAESWLGESWRELLDQGIQQVTLLEDGRVEYGPMPLTPAE
jgi:hypothetical protein